MGQRGWRAVLPLEYATYALLVAALTVGGGGVAAPEWPSTLCELLALIVIALAIGSHRSDLIDPAAKPAIAFALILAVTAAVQLIPVPPDVWRSLPGRGLAVAVRDVIGAGQAWYPLSLAPERTLASGLALLLPIAAFLALVNMDGDARRRIVILLVVLMVFDLLLGLAQILSPDPARLAVFPSVHSGRAIGFFVNRNHNADLLAIAPLLIAALAKNSKRTYRHHFHSPLIAGAVIVFGVAVVTTASRFGFILYLISAAATVAMVFARRPSSVLNPRALVALLVAGGVAFAAVAALLADNIVVNRLRGRFALLSDDGRVTIWQDTWYAAKQFWPIGSGLGTFDPVFRTVERLESVTRQWVNHAHNDYLELFLELGLWGLVLLALFGLLYGLALGTVLRRAFHFVEPLSFAAAVGTLVLLVHSLADYPLRTHSLATVFAVLLALLYAPRAAVVPAHVTALRKAERDSLAASG